MADYISRDEAIKAVKSQTCWHYNNSMIDEHGIISNIDKIHAVDVRPVVRGKWKNSDFIPGMLACNKCGAQRNPKFKIGGGTWSFCPNCGADMRGNND